MEHFFEYCVSTFQTFDHLRMISLFNLDDRFPKCQKLVINFQLSDS